MSPKKESSKIKLTNSLRKQAEKRIPGQADSIGKMSEIEVKKLVHELQVHHIELEMQNEALHRSQTETAEEHRKYTSLYDFAPVGYFTLDEKGRITEANVTGATMLGFEKRSLAGEPFYRFICPGYFSIFQSHLQQAEQTRNKQTLKTKLVKRDGLSFEALIDTIAIADGEGNFEHYRSSVTDITEIIKAELLLESEMKYRGLYESTKDGMIMTDVAGHVLECNSAYSDMLGYTEKEIKGLTYQQVTPAKWHSLEEDIVRNKVFKKGYSDIYEKEYIKKDGTVFPVAIRAWSIKDSLGNMTGMWAIVSNITERKQAESQREAALEALHQSEMRYRSIFQNNHTVMLLIDPETAEIVDTNPAACHYYGYAIEEMRKKKITEINTLTPEQTFAEMQKAKEEKRYSFEFLHRVANGEIHPVQVFSGPIKLGGRHLLFSIVHDISKRKTLEIVLNKRSEQLEAANKELESFSYSVSHDLRAPLRAIDGYARMILKSQGDKLDIDTLKKFNVIRSNAQMMGRLIDNLLAFSRVGKSEISLSTIDMLSLFKGVWNELQIINPGRNIELTLKDILPGCGDRALIKQVYFNLLSNAVKFTQKTDAAHIETGSYMEGTQNIYYVKDNGAGFDMEYYDKLFGVFQRLHTAEDFEGTGVGLAIVQRIILRHGGRVWAQAKPDQGATFYFALPSTHIEIASYPALPDRH